jgi:hypothetical protein
MLLQHAFKEFSGGVYIHTRSNGKLYNIAKPIVTKILIRKMLFDDDATLTKDGPKQLVTSLTHKEFRLNISLKNNNVMTQCTENKFYKRFHF